MRPRSSVRAILRTVPDDAQAQIVELEIKRERITKSIRKRREAGQDLDDLPSRTADNQVRNAIRSDTGEGPPGTQKKSVPLLTVTLGSAL